MFSDGTTSSDGRYLVTLGKIKAEIYNRVLSPLCRKQLVFDLKW